MRPVSVSVDRLQRVEGLREPQRLSHQLSTLLAAEIVSGRLGVGEAFPSSEEIVTRFGVSRTVAREMVQALAMLGLVNIQHGKRTEVCPAEDWDILSSVVQEALRREGKAEPLLRDLYEFRLLIEPQAAGWMAEYGRPRDVAELGELVTSMERLADTEVAVVEVLDADRRFHNLVARASDNRVIAAVSRDIREVIGTLWGFSTLDAADARQVAKQHRRIADAVQLHDAGAAAAAMRDHLAWAAQADLHGLGEPATALRFASAAAD
jgi:DNA-binding FadR family transcriptional regulator